MSTKKPSNIEIVNSVLEETTGLKATFNTVESQADLEKLYERVATYPSAKNEFYEELVNKVAKTVIANLKTFKNPLSELQKGKLLFGEGIENIFVEFLQSKSYEETKHFEGHTTSIDDLVKALPPKLKVDYLTRNFDREYKTSISDAQLRKAFYTENGMSDLVAKIVGNLVSSANRDMYKDIKEALTRQDEELTISEHGTKFGKGLTKLVSEDVTLKTTAMVSVAKDETMDMAKKLAYQIRKFSNDLTFPSDKYNLAKVETFTDKDDLVYITTSGASALLDVEVLANAFNISSVDVKAKNILVDDLGQITTDGGAKNVVGILCDKNLIQHWLITELTTTFTNPERKNMQNFFHFIEGISGLNPFAQFVILHD